MRLWSIHPKYLDCKGLTALWREGLLAKKVLEDKTTAYRNHPHLIRFRNTKYPKGAINTYLYVVLKEAEKRCYCFDRSKLGMHKKAKMPVTNGQLEYEFRHLKKKLKTRDNEQLKKLHDVKKIQAHPLFFIIKGKKEPWER